MKCDHTLFEAYLSNRLDAQRSDDFERHLDVCPDCCESMRERAAGEAWWHEAEHFLADLPTESHVENPAPRSSRSSSADQVDVSFLFPSDDPQMLGRIGTYEITGVIGLGGMGIVLKAFDAALNRYVAIKVLSPALANSSAARSRFAREAQAAAAVVHDHVVPIHGVSEHDGLPYLVMPYVRGESLQCRLNRHAPLTPVEVVRIAMQCASALAAAHGQGLVHRDIKPANILLDQGVERVRITDFGLAMAVDDASLTRTGVVAGTPHFMSPEQARGETVDHRSDLFSLGSVMYLMLTGRLPFRAETSLAVLRKVSDEKPTPIRALNPSVPPWLERLVTRLHEKSPVKRFDTAKELESLLAQCLQHLQNPQAGLPVWLRISPWFCRRPGAWHSAGAFVVLVAMLGLAWAPKFWQGGTAIPRPADATTYRGPVTNEGEPQSLRPSTSEDEVIAIQSKPPVGNSLVASMKSASDPPDRIEARLDALRQRLDALRQEIQADTAQE